MVISVDGERIRLDLPQIYDARSHSSGRRKRRSPVRCVSSTANIRNDSGKMTKTSHTPSRKKNVASLVTRSCNHFTLGATVQRWKSSSANSFLQSACLLTLMTFNMVTPDRGRVGPIYVAMQNELWVHAFVCMMVARRKFGMPLIRSRVFATPWIRWRDEANIWRGSELATQK